MTLVEVPRTVITPPNTAAWLRGIRNGEGERPVRRAHATTRGASSATSGVLAMNAEASSGRGDDPREVAALGRRAVAGALAPEDDLGDPLEGAGRLGGARRPRTAPRR